MRAVAPLAAIALAALCVLRHDELAAAVVAIPPAALGGLVALHVLSLCARSEAWRLSLAAIGDGSPPRMVVHTANAGAFVAGSLEPHAALPARVALLRRLSPGAAPHPGHVAVADIPIFLLEVVGIAGVLALTGAWWAPMVALLALAVARGAVGRRATRGLAVLADVRRRGALAAVVGCIVACGMARVWLALAVAHLDASPAAVAAAFGALGAFGLLPLGPSAPPGALLVVAGGAAGALAAGLALSATSIAAVLVYAAAMWLAGQDPRPRTFVQRLRGVHVFPTREEDAVRAMALEPGTGDAGTLVTDAARFARERRPPAADEPEDAEALSRDRLRRLTEAVHRVMADERRALIGRGGD